jgi:hypothetical protein
MEVIFHQKTARRLIMMNWNGEEKFVLYVMCTSV